MTKKLGGLLFNCTNIINFLLIGFIVIKIKEIVTEKYNMLVKNNKITTNIRVFKL